VVDAGRSNASEPAHLAHDADADDHPERNAIDHEAVIALLSDPATHDGEPVARVDTHISHIFLAGDRAYKLKRPIRTNFLDFRTPERREAACRRELEVNRALAGTLYLDVLPIVRREGALRLGGQGEAVDWVVAMRRFDRERELDRVADRGELDVAKAEALADAVAEMHCAAPRTPRHGGAAKVRATIRQIAGAIEAAPGAAPAADRVEAWREAAEERLSPSARQLESRRRHGHVRRCHGDLHLGNIVLLDGRPTPFDALEFDEEMASTDVLYDIAFVLMDLRERGLVAEANAFLGRYLSVTRDFSGLGLLPLFVSMRAAVRALVAASRQTPEPGAPDADARLDFALEALRQRPAPELIAIGGLSGSGKSTVARRAAPRIGPGAGAVVLRSDLTRKRMFGVSPEGRLPEAAYRSGVVAAVYERLRRDAGRALRAGRPVILDATFLAAEEREAARRLAASAGVPFHGLWLACDPDEMRRRVAARRNDASDADLTVLERQLAEAEEPADWTRIRSEGPVDAAVASTLEAVEAG